MKNLKKTIRNLLGLVLGVALFVGVSCTRATLRSYQTLVVQLPSARTLAEKNSKVLKTQGVATIETVQPQSLVVQVSGVGISTPLIYEWNAEARSGGVPSQISLDVPSGSGRLVQVLFVMQSGSGLVFDYGRSTLDLGSSPASVTVEVSPLQSAANVPGRITGRYILANGVAPTGSVALSFLPPGGMSRMVIEKAEIFSGFFNFLALSDLPLTYTLEDGTVLFSEVTLDALATNPVRSGANVATTTAYIPAVSRADSGLSSSLPQYLMYGFFGPGTSAGRQLCFDGSGVVPDAYSGAAMSSPLYWMGSAISQLSYLQTSGSAGPFLGTYRQSCSGTPFVDSLTLTRLGVASPDRALGFRGPFLSNINAHLLDFGTLNGNMVVSWNWLPTLTASDLDGVEVFTKTSPGTLMSATGLASYRDNGGGFACGDLQSLFGFSSAGKENFGTNSIVLSNVNAGTDIEIVACPYKATGALTRYFMAAADGNPSIQGAVALPPPPTCSSTYALQTSFVTTGNYGLLASTNNGCTLLSTGADTYSYTYGVPLATGVTANKFYFEVSVEALDTAGGARIGVGLALDTLVSDSTSSSYSLGSFIANNARGYVYTGSSCMFASSTTGCPTAVTGQVIGVAVDATTGSIWWALDNNWFTNGGSFSAGSPTFTNGTLAHPAGALVPVITMVTPGAGANQATVITKGAAMHHSPPAGFTTLE